MKQKYETESKKELAYSSWYMRFTPELGEFLTAIDNNLHWNKIMYLMKNSPNSKMFLYRTVQ